MRDMMPPSIDRVTALLESEEVFVEETALAAWIEDTGLYLRLDADEPATVDEPPE